MYAYILDNRNLSVKDVLEFENHDFRWDIDFNDKGSISVVGKPNVENDDFVVCKYGNEIMFQGICENCTAASDRETYTVSLMQIEQLFSRQIFVGNEAMIVGTGIEDFIASEIRSNFVDSGDMLTDKAYINVVAATHTPVAARVDAENGIYNLKTYLGNARQYYGICLDFSFLGNSLDIVIRKCELEQLPIDTGISDITGYDETYEVSVLSKLIVHWKVPDTEGAEGAVTTKFFYLLEDRTITEDGTDNRRAKGIIKSLYIEAQEEAEMQQQVYNEFAGNTYNHKISFGIRKGSQCYPEADFSIGRKCLIKTCAGVKASMVTGIAKVSTSNLVQITMGNLKITLIDKLRRR